MWSLVPGCYSHKSGRSLRSFGALRPSVSQYLPWNSCSLWLCNLLVSGLFWSESINCSSPSKFFSWVGSFNVWLSCHLVSISKMEYLKCWPLPTCRLGFWVCLLLIEFTERLRIWRLCHRNRNLRTLRKERGNCFGCGFLLTANCSWYLLAKRAHYASAS